MGTEGGGHLPEVTHPADDYPGFTTLSFAEGGGHCRVLSLVDHDEPSPGLNEECSSVPENRNQNKEVVLPLHHIFKKERPELARQLSQ